MAESFCMYRLVCGRGCKALPHTALFSIVLQLCIVVAAQAQSGSQLPGDSATGSPTFSDLRSGESLYTDFILKRSSMVTHAAPGVAAGALNVPSQTIAGIAIAAVYQQGPVASGGIAALKAGGPSNHLCVPGPKAIARATRLGAPLPECPFDGMTVVRMAEAVTGEKAIEIMTILASSTGAEVTPVPMASLQASPNDPVFASGAQWHIPKVSLPEAWNISQGSSEITIAVVDTGVVPTHRDLAARLQSGYDFYSHDADPTDFVGHGTGVAGVIGAISNNGIGVAGVDWNARLLPIKVFPDGPGQAPYTAIAEGIVYAADQGSDVINLSLGGAIDHDIMRDAVNYALSLGVVVVAAAGNSGTSAPIYPAAYPGVISVAALRDDDRRVGFSSFGLQVDIAAPGQDIASVPFDQSMSHSGYSGTSFAAPIVAGVAGLILGRNLSASLSDVRGAILTGVDDISGLNPQYASLLGSGRLNALKALQATPHRAVKLSGIVSDALYGNNDGVIDRGERIEVKVAVDSLWLATGSFELSASAASDALLPVDADSITLSDLNGGETATASFTFDVAADAPYNSPLLINLNAVGVGFERLSVVPVVVEFPVMDGWTRYPAGPTQAIAGEPAFVDVNGDGTLEVGFANNCNDNLVVLDQNGSPLSPWPQTRMFGLYTPLAWGDITGDGIPEVVSGAGAGHPDDPAKYPQISAQKMNGDIVSGFPRIITPPVAPNVFTFSTRPGLIPYPGTVGQKLLFAEVHPQSVGQFRGTTLHLLNSDGSHAPGWPKDIGRAISDRFAPLSQGDIDGDGIREFAVQYSNLHLNPGREPNRDESVGPLVVYGIDGTERLTLNHTGYFGVPCKDALAGPVFADVDGDGKDEVFSFSGCGAQLWNRSGSLLPGFPSIDGLPNPETTAPREVWYRASSEPPLAADLENDGELEFVWTFTRVDRDSQGGTTYVRHYLAVMNPNGAMKTGFPIQYDNHAKGVADAEQPRLIDVDGDGKLEILVTATGSLVDHSVQGFRFTGAALENFPIRYSSIGSSSFAVADLNDDGRFDYVSEPLDMKNIEVRSFPFEYRAAGQSVDTSQLLWWNHRYADPARTNYRPISGSVIGAPVPTPVIPTPTPDPSQQPPAPVVKKKGSRLEVRMMQGGRNYQIQLTTRGRGSKRTVTSPSARATISIGRSKISEVRYRMRKSSWSKWSRSTVVR